MRLTDLLLKRCSHLDLSIPLALAPIVDEQEMRVATVEGRLHAGILLELAVAYLALFERIIGPLERPFTLELRLSVGLGRCE